MDKIELEGFFTLMDFSLTHKMLLIRNTEVINEEAFNTDVVFISTFYMEIPTILTDITIEQGTYEDCRYIQEKCEEEFVGTIQPKNVFILYSSKKKYYIGARNIEISNNTHDPLETSLGPKRK